MLNPPLISPAPAPPAAVEPTGGSGVVPYPNVVSGAPLSFDLKALLTMAAACAVLHLAQATLFGVQLTTRRNVSWFANFYGWYWVLTACIRAIVASFLVLGVVGIWTRRSSGVPCTIWSIVVLIALGLVEAVMSVVSFVNGPPRPTEAAGVMMSILQTLLMHYGILLLLIYVLKRPMQQGGPLATMPAGDPPRGKRD